MLCRATQPRAPTGVGTGLNFPGFRTPPAPKMYLRLFVCLFAFFPFSCVPSILDDNNEQGKPRWFFKVNYCGELFFEVFCYHGQK